MGKEVEIRSKLLKTQTFSVQSKYGQQYFINCMIYWWKCHAQKEKFAKNLIAGTKGEPIFTALKTHFKKACILLTNIIACTAGGIPVMAGRHGGDMWFLKKEILEVFVIFMYNSQITSCQCLSPSLHNSLTITVNAIN